MNSELIEVGQLRMWTKPLPHEGLILVLGKYDENVNMLQILVDGVTATYGTDYLLRNTQLL